MKVISVINKSLKEQLRSFWILLLTLSMGPFFIFVYFLIIETSKPHYDILIVNNDKGYTLNDTPVNYGSGLTEFFKQTIKDSINLPLTIKDGIDRKNSIEKLKNKNADALIIVPDDYSEHMNNFNFKKDSISPAEIEFMGDLTNINYLISAVWANGIVEEFTNQLTGAGKVLKIKETGVGSSGSINDFDIIVPGLLILSLIMLMFTATIAFVSEVENKTIIRLKLSKISPLEFISGVSLVQLIVGISSILLTLVMAILLGFKFNGSILMFLAITILTSMSIIAFSLIIAAITKTVNEVLIVGNFPMFLFMFFTGAAFPLKSDGLFTISGYPVSLQGLMSPTHAISALNKILVMNMKFTDILPEIISLIILTVIYFIVGVLLFNRRHMQLEK
jgi:ABC-2 type transport system permease protein